VGSSNAFPREMGVFLDNEWGPASHCPFPKKFAPQWDAAA
jgi:hypothetical protein